MAESADVGKKPELANGSIVRIKMKSFLTYDEVEVRPGPGLNLIVGPNGTGKSTIVCAIALGLAGKPEVLGRSKSIGDYIKHGEKCAVIEIELKMKKRNLVVRRFIRKPASSEWYLNGHRSTEKEVSDEVRKVNIQVDNLCQFLAQDRVVEFSRLNERDLLLETQKATSPELYQMHNQLKNQHSDGIQLKKDLDRLKDRVDELQKKLNGLKPDVEAVKERKVLESDMKLIECKKLFLEYEEARVQVTDMNRDLKKTQADFVEYQAKCAPDEAKLKEFSASVKSLNDKIGSVRSETTKCRSLILSEQRKIEDCCERIENLKSALLEKQKEEQERQVALEKSKSQIEKMQEQIENESSTGQDFKPALQVITTNLRKAEQEKYDFDDKIQALEAERRHKNTQISDRNRYLSDLQSVERRTLDKLRGINSNVYEALMWYKANKKLFRGHIHEPIMLSLKLNKAEDAKFVENVISMRDMLTFVCEVGEDSDLFLRECRDKHGWRINCAAVPLDNASFAPAPIPNNILQLGFRCMVSELFEAPEGVMKYLCRLTRINCIPVGNEKVERNLQQVIARVRDNFKRFLTPNKSISIKLSRYSNKTSTSDSSLRTPHILAQFGSSTNADEEVVNKVANEKEELTHEAEKITADINQLQQNSRKVASDVESMRQEKAQLQQKASRKRTLESQLVSFMERLKHQQADLNRFNLVEDQQTTQRQVVKQMRARLACYKQITKSNLIATKNIQQLGDISTQQTDVMSKLAAVEITLAENVQIRDELKIRLDDMMERFVVLKDLAKSKCKRAMEKCGMKSTETDLPAKLKQEMAHLPGTLPEISKRWFDCKARFELCTRGSSDTLEEYDRTNAQHEAATKDFETLDNRLQHFDQETETLKEKWLGPMQEQVAIINRNFGHFFQALNCAGEVELAHGLNPNDFNEYALKLKVKFREGESLKELTSHRQSGGERSVATILYMLALQELSQVPFRVVDEINQGMDPQNERKVFEMMVDLLCGGKLPNCESTTLSQTQYFMLTPKLLPGLIYPEGCTVLVIFNGKKMIPGKDWNLDTFIARARALKDNSD